jgi:RNA polymerase sigma factor (sigma-70 family)
MTDDQLTTLQNLLERIRKGDQSAGDALFRSILDRLEGTARKMKRRFPGLARYEDTGDVQQQVAIRLWQKLLRDPPATVPLFFSVVARNIRDVLIDRLRHYYGPEGPGGKIESNALGGNSDSGVGPLYERGSDTHNPAEIAIMTDLWEQVEALPDEEREVFELLWTGELTQQQAATLLSISVKTVRSRYQRARMRLGRALQDGQGNR